MSKISRLKSGSYSTVIYLGLDANGKKIQKQLTHPDKKILKQMAQDYVAAHKKPTRITMAMAMDGYIEANAPKLSPSTVRGYKNIVKQLKGRFPVFCDTKLDMIDGDRIQKVVDQLTEEGKSPKTVRNYYGFIGSVMKWKRIRMDVVSLPKKNRQELNVPGNDVVREILEAAEGTELEIPIMLAATCGMRRGEICALTMEDFDGNVCHISKDIVMGPDGTWHIKPPKTFGSDRFIEVPEFVMKKIREKGYITHFNPHSLTDVHRRFLQNHGLQPYRFHDYRHYMVSSMHAARIPDSYIMQRGGWSIDFVMKGVYRHTLEDQDASMVKMANDHFTKNLLSASGAEAGV